MELRPPAAPPLLSEAQAADIMSMSPRTLQSYRTRKCGPPFLRIGNRIKYCPRALNAWMAARYNVPAPRKAKPVTLAHRPVLSDRMIELIVGEIERGRAGEVYIGATAHRRLSQALRPMERRIAMALCRNGVIPRDGTVRLAVPRNQAARDPDLDPPRGRWDTVSVTYDPRSGRWTSEAGAGQPGIGDFCRHVWRIQGRREGMAERDLLAFIGAAYLALLSEGRPA